MPLKRLMKARIKKKTFQNLSKLPIQNIEIKLS